MEEKGMAS